MFFCATGAGQYLLVDLPSAWIQNLAQDVNLHRAGNSCYPGLGMPIEGPVRSVLLQMAFAAGVSIPLLLGSVLLSRQPDFNPAAPRLQHQLCTQE